MYTAGTALFPRPSAEAPAILDDERTVVDPPSFLGDAVAAARLGDPGRKR